MKAGGLHTHACTCRAYQGEGRSSVPPASPTTTATVHPCLGISCPTLLRPPGYDGPQGYLCVRFDGGSVDIDHQTARVQLCAVANPDVPCCSVLPPESQVQLLPSPPAASTPPPDEYPKTPLSTRSGRDAVPSPNIVPRHSPEDSRPPTPTASSPSYPPSYPPAYPPAYTPVPTYPPSYSSSPLPLSHEEAPPPGYGDAQQQDNQEPWRPRRLRLG